MSEDNIPTDINAFTVAKVSLLAAEHYHANCDQWTHLLCARSMTPTLYQELCNSGENFDLLCNRCSIGNLPFADVDDILSLTPTPDVSLSLSASISEEEDIFHDLRLVKNRCRNNVIISHLNINSLRHTFHDLSDLFSDRLVDIHFISETKLHSTFTQAQFDAPGYNYFRKYRNCHGGGLLAYIISDLPARRRPDLELSRIESVIIEITIHNRKWGIICAYRPPSMNNSFFFIDDFTAGVDRLHVGLHFDNVIVAGDLNYDNIPQKCQPLQSVCDIFDFTNLITKPTCLTKYAPPSIVDVILTNIPSFLFNITNISCGISDWHNIISVVIKGHAPPPKQRKIKCRGYSVRRWVSTHPSCHLITSNIPTPIPFDFKPITKENIQYFISKSGSKKATGVDGIPAKIFKSCSRTISEPLSKLINFSLVTSTFPNILKQAQVIPVYKKKDPPISITTDR